MRISILTILLTAIGCQSLSNEHKITSNAVELQEIKYNRNHNYCFVTYSLDVGARGTRLYKTLMSTKELGGNLLQGHLPTGVVFKEWLNDSIIHVAYDPYLEGLNATGNKGLIDTFKSKDTVSVQQVTFIVTERKNSR
ncbi:MAG TPA: hypothetical protein VD794_14490 [Flavisolibacter sp.]|nr:hypothetical protein [Flavisolibacter sp.]